VLALFGLASALLSVVLAVAVNVATGGELPGGLAGFRHLAWPAVGALALVTMGLAVWQQRLEERERGERRRPRGPQHPVPKELPAAPLHFTGRAAELRRIRAELDRGASVVAIAGPAGVGKTALALELAYSLLDRYPDGQLYVRLRGSGPRPARPRAVLARFLTALGAPADELRGDEDALAVRYRTRLAGRRMLVLLDDAAGATQVRPLLPGSPTCLTVVTSRPLLGDLTATLVDLRVLAEEDARSLFAAVAGRARVEAEPEATAAVLRACGYLPLAMRIAAGRLRVRPSWPVAALAARLADERSRLDELRLGDTDIRAVFAATYEELPEDVRRAFRRLGAHPGPDFGPGAAAALAATGESQARTAVERLVDTQLVEIAQADRYRLHDLVRLFAGERLAAEEPAGDRAAALGRLAGWYAAAARTAEPGWLRGERENLAAVVHRLVEGGEHAAALDLADALRRLLEQDPGSPLAADRSFWTDLMAAARAAGGPDRLARALLQLGTADRAAGLPDDALAHLREALELAGRGGDRLLEARGLRALGHALRDAGRHGEAIDRYRQALARYAELGRPGEEADVLDGLGMLHIARNQSAEALAHLERAERLRGEPGVGGGAWTRMLLGAANRLQGRLDEASGLIESGLEAFRAEGDRLGEGYALRELGALACDQARPGDGVRLHAQAEAVFAQLDHELGVGLAQESRGDACREQGELAEATRAYEQGAATFHRLGDRAREGRCLLELAEVLARRGQLRPARERSAAAERLLDGLDLPEVEAVRGRLAQLGVPAG